MALSLYAGSIVAKNGNATSVSLTIPVGAFAGADGACVIVSIAVAGGTGAFITAPSGWTLVKTVNSTTVIQLSTYVRNATAADEGVTFTWTWTGTRQHSAGMEAWAGGGIAAQTGQSTPSAMTHTALALTANLSGSVMRCAFAIAKNGTWTPDAAQTEDVDTTSASTTSIETAHDFLAGTGSSGTRTATATGPAAVGCTQSIILAPSGATQPTGTGGTIYLYDNTLSADGISYKDSDLITLYPSVASQVVDAAVTTTFNQSVQIGDLGVGSAPTTFEATKRTIKFASAKAFLWRATQQASWRIKLGTKIGTGVEAGGRDGVHVISNVGSALRGNYEIYDSRLEFSGSSTVVIEENVGGIDTQEIMDCTFEHHGTSTTSSFRVGGLAGEKVDTVYNCLFIGHGINAVLTGFSATNSARNKTQSSVGTALILAGQGTDLVMKDLTFKGTPTTSDYRTQGTAARWRLFRPGWTRTKPKFSGLAPGTLADAHWEMWRFDAKVSREDGVPLANIPVDLSDGVGTAILSQRMTDSEGRVSFEFVTGVPNGVAVQDHYSAGTSGLGLVRERSPFTVTYNGGAGRNPAYAIQTKTFQWPGIDDGNFSDVLDIVPLAALAQPQWAECLVDAVA